MSIANQLETKLMQEVFGNTSFANITTIYGALHTGDPGETATASFLASAKPQTIVFNTATSAVTNAATVTWTCSSTGTITYISLRTASTTGGAVALWSGALTASKVVANVGDQVQLASAALTVTLT